MKKFALPEVEKVGEQVVGADMETSRDMFGDKYWPIVYYAPESGSCIVTHPTSLTMAQLRALIDLAIAALTTSRP
jgi:hypothetical protein